MLQAGQANIRSFRVVPSLPEPLKPLLEIARNLWWTWNPEAVSLFTRLDPDEWTRSHHNPIKMLGHISQERLEQFARDESYLHEIYRVYSGLHHHMTRQSWFDNRFPDAKDATVAYFSAEFGLTECFQIYSGGLGVLAGDHLKSASELGVPLVGVGLLYQHGYFQQYLNTDGWQQETYPDLDVPNQAIERVRDASGKITQVTVRLPGRDVAVGLWRVMVGRVRLFLLDTNLRENRPEDRQITRNLYGGDVETRIQQEIILGIGGTRALAAMGVRPTVCHINEGHAAFLALERIRLLIQEKGLNFEEALEQTKTSHVFTTHTPVPAGIDRFHPSLMEQYFREKVGKLKIDMPTLLALGRENPGSSDEYFSMAVLAIRTCYARNGVSKLHGVVSRRMWKSIWPAVPEEEIPITHVTNGVHTRSWLSNDVYQLYNRYLGYRWQHDPTDYTVWERVDEIPDEELWSVHLRRRRRLITWVRGRVREQFEARGTTIDQIERAAGALDPDAFTIGFARRFATYKRATLLLRDPERLLRLLSDPNRPIQMIISGKSHPADGAGKEFIRQIVHFATTQAGRTLANRIVFLENYDMNIARYLVTGCDLWLNTPRRGLEASGTSGMKAAINGVINCSILDGWWDEAYESRSGFAIGRREQYASEEQADEIESNNLFDLIENTILPEFYDRDSTGIPRRWVGRMKSSIKSIAPYFNTNRMVQEYAENLYIPSHRRAVALAADGFSEARGLAHHLGRYRTYWHQIRIESVKAETAAPIPVRQALNVEAVVHLGDFSPEELSVQLYAGAVNASGDLTSTEVITMSHVDALGQGRHRFIGRLISHQSGRRGFSVRVIPADSRLATPILPGLICWDQSRDSAGDGATADDVQAVAMG